MRNKDASKNAFLGYVRIPLQIKNTKNVLILFFLGIFSPSAIGVWERECPPKFLIVAESYQINAKVPDFCSNRFFWFGRAMAQGLPGTITLYSADLLDDGAFDAACENAHAVIHAAAQVDPTVIEDPWKDMVGRNAAMLKPICV